MNTYRYAIKELVRHRTRTAVNILGYAIAVAFMVTVISMTQSYSLAAVDVLKSTGAHFMAFIPQSQPRCEGQFESGPVAEGVYNEALARLPIGGRASACPAEILFRQPI